MINYLTHTNGSESIEIGKRNEVTKMVVESIDEDKEIRFEIGCESLYISVDDAKALVEFLNKQLSNQK